MVELVCAGKNGCDVIRGNVVRKAWYRWASEFMSSRHYSHDRRNAKLDRTFRGCGRTNPSLHFSGQPAIGCRRYFCRNADLPGEEP